LKFADRPRRCRAEVAASSSAVGKRVRLKLRERTPGRSVVKDTVSAGVALRSSFKQLSLSATTVGTGNALDVRVAQASAASGNAFFADQITLARQTPR
jgi:hypothetical protein